MGLEKIRVSYPLNNPLSKGWVAARSEVRVVRVIYDLSRIDIGGPSVHA
jgi:hypothetical protein